MSDQEPFSIDGYPLDRDYFRGELETEKGVRHLSWGIGVYILAMLLIFVGVILALNVVISALDGPPDPEAVPGLIGLCGLLGGGVVLIFMAIILWLLGLYEMNQGKKEFGPEHMARVKSGVILVLTYIILSVISIILQLETGPDPRVDMPGYISFLRTQSTVSGVIGLASTIVLSLAIVYLVLELCNERYRRILWGSFVLSIALSIMGTALTFFFLYGDLSTMTVDEILQLASLAMLAAGLSFIPFILFYFCYRHAFFRVRNWEVKPHRDAFPWIGDDGTPLIPRKLAGICTKCGSQRYEGERFCAKCGNRFKTFRK
ncbi:MAG: zinc ribbon domain-containing protein [Methanobacteriota archaeon]|nr:MAG: zinc ribbon domain-containing protein [Euryarchaeota archaeon]